MKLFSSSRIPANLLLLAFGWLIINLIQAAYTELFHDEAYYWMFSRHLNWAYFEHPGMIAWMIALTSRVPGELGVRLTAVVANLIALAVVVRLSDERQRTLTLWVMAGMVITHLGGIFAAPDAPLALFAALFYLSLAHFLKKDGLLPALLLGLTMAGMLFSKYHGALLIGFAVIGYPALFRNRYFWLAGLTALLLCTPLVLHLWEQQMATFAFHLGSRIRKPWDIGFLGSFLSGQILLYGPFVGVMLFAGAFLGKTTDPFGRVLKATVIGMTGFLLLLSFRTWVEANWSAGMYVPLVLLGVKWMAESEARKKWAMGLSVAGVIFAFSARLMVLFPDFFPEIQGLRNEVHGWKAWAERVSDLAGDRPVAIVNSYGLPAKYTFYTGKSAFALNNVQYHRTQYEAWDMEQTLRGKEILYVAPNEFEGGTPLGLPEGRKFHYTYLRNFHSYNNVYIQSPQKQFLLTADDTLRATLVLKNGYNQPVDFDAWLPVTVTAIVYKGNKLTKVYPHVGQVPGLLNDERETGVVVPVSLPPGSYRLIFTLTMGNFNPGINGAFIPLEITAQ